MNLSPDLCAASLMESAEQVLRQISWGVALDSSEDQAARRLVRRGVLGEIEEGARFGSVSDLHRHRALHLSVSLQDAYLE